jgi:putative endonuclease
VEVINRRSEGSRYEDLACAYLEKKGYKILDRNVYLMRKELDIVAADGSTVVFVEVKGRRSSRFGSPAEAVGRTKQKRMSGAAAAYLKRKGLMGESCRFDFLGIRLHDGGKMEFDHIVNAFEYSGGGAGLL